MKSKGIRIFDLEDKILIPTLSDILKEIPDGNSLFWSIQFLDGILNPEEDRSFLKKIEKINNSKNGIKIQFSELYKLSSKFFQMYETEIIGCKTPDLLMRYETEEEMFKTCDIVIILIDRSFWEVYSKNQSTLIKLQNRFTKTEFIQN